MSDKKESEKNPPTKSLKCSVSIEIYLKMREKKRRLELLQKQRSFLDTMKEEHKRLTGIEKPENMNTEPKEDDKPNMVDVGDVKNEGPIPAPVVPPAPILLLPCRPCKAHLPRPKRLRRLPYVAPPPRARGAPRPQHDLNNNNPMQQNNMMIGGYRAVAPVYHNMPQNPIMLPRYH